MSRERIVERLQDHYAQSDIEVDELERRLVLAESKKLDAAVAGLPALRQAPGEVRALFSGAGRRGRWRVPPEVKVRAVCGSVLLDLVDAEVPRDVLIDVSVTFGVVRIDLPEGYDVEVRGSGLFGTVDGDESTGRKGRIVVVGRARFGSVEVRVRQVGLLDKVKGFLVGR